MPRFAWVTAAILAVTIAQLGVAFVAPGLQQFQGKAFGARLVIYPVLMLSVPVCGWLLRRRSSATSTASWPVPWGAFALWMAPFAIDVTGNTLDLYDTVSWWDDVNHLVNWALLSGGLGALAFLQQRPAHEPMRVPSWVVVLAVTGLGAILAIGWEVGEWFTFIRHGTELDVAYTDTLGDETLGTAGAFIAAMAVSAIRARQHETA